MTREILFRGKSISTGEWIEGDGIHYPKSINYLGTCWIDGMEDRANDWIQVDPATVGQYTGLCDKNGVKIFEGDILRDGLGDDGVVTYFESIASFKYQVGNEVWNLNEGDPNRSTQLQYTEIIGNIHDNPELMEVSE